ncbi:MAG: S8 family serine peptidase [Bdellovibrionota bacterium]
MNKQTIFSRVFAALVFLGLGVSSTPVVHSQEKIPVRSASDLPQFNYKVSLSEFGGDYANIPHPEYRSVVERLARELLANIESTLKKYDIQDVATLQNYWTLAGIAHFMLGNFDAYAQYTQWRMDQESKEAIKQTTSLFYRAYAQAQKEDRNFDQVLRELLDGINYEIAYKEIWVFQGRATILEKEFVSALLNHRLSQIFHSQAEEVGQSVVISILNYFINLNYVIPYNEQVLQVIREYVEENKDRIQVASIFPSTPIYDRAGEGVLIGIWDSGVDPDTYERFLWNNKEEKMDGIDNDGNGFVDDIHGPSYDLESRITTGSLYPIENFLDQAAEKEMYEYEKGQIDLFDFGLTPNESPSIQTYKKVNNQAITPEAQQKLEVHSGVYSNYIHGSHVAGIAIEGNPYAKILSARITYPHTFIPPKPTLAGMHREAKSYRDTVDYFKRQGVKVVNMSFGSTYDDLDEALEKNGVSNIQRRKILAKRYFHIIEKSLYEAMAGAPDILFVVAAGNSNNNNEFSQMIPSKFDLPNILTVGAVDAQGKIAGFTTTGKVDIYANGENVLSKVPRRRPLHLSGTSMAAPQVTNLAGKLWALYPYLGVNQVKALILDNAVDVDSEGLTLSVIDAPTSLKKASAYGH